MALTLLEASKQMTGDVVRQSIVEVFARSHPLLEALPFNTIAGNAYKYNQELSLPGIGFRGVNEAFSESAGVINPEVEQLVIAGGDLDVDKFILDTMGMNQRASRVAQKVKHLSHVVGHKFIKGSSTTTADEFDGLQARLSGGQVIYVGTTDGGDVLSLARLDALIDLVESPTHLIMSRAMKRLLTAASRLATVGGTVNFTTDSFGRPVTTYAGLPIITMDGPSQYYTTLDFDEVGYTGSTTSATSIYCVSLGDGMLTGIHNAPPSVRDLGEQDSKPVYRTRVEWYMSIVLEHPYAAARLGGIKTGAVVV